MSDGRCPNCDNTFEKNSNQRSYKRTKLGTLYTPKTCKTLFPSLNNDQFVCKNCSDNFREETSLARGSKKRRLFTPNQQGPSFSPLAKKAKVLTPVKVVHRKGFRGSAVTDILACRYKSAVRVLVKRSIKGREAVKQVVGEIIKREITDLKKQTKLFSRPFSIESIQTFSWEDAHKEMDALAPFSTAVLRAVFPPPQRIMKTKRPLTSEDADHILKCRTGMLMAVALYTSSPLRFNFLQTCIGVQLWREGCSHKVYSSLNKFGLSQGHKAARRNIDSIGQHHADKVCEWKASIERKETCPGYSLCWDNIQIESTAKHQGLGEGRENKFFLWAMCFAIQNRVPTAQILPPMKNSKDHRTVNASEINPWELLPTPGDYNRLKNRMLYVLKQILVDHIPMLRKIKVKRPFHNPHRDAMKSKSNVVNLGVIEANPSSTAGVTRIMRKLQEYTPCSSGENLHTIICHGDNASVERMTGCRRAAVNALTPAGRLEGLEEGPQEFHKEGLLLQDYINKFFSGNSITDRGTVAHLKTAFGHRSLKTKVMQNFKHCWDIMQFTTESYIVLMALKLRGMETLESEASCFPSEGPLAKQIKWVDNLSLEIMEQCWMAPSYEHLRTVATSLEDSRKSGEADEECPFPFCSCGTDKDEPMVLCCSGNCRTEWFHLSCKGLAKQPEADQDWYCSLECRNSGSYIYCLCNQNRPNSIMVQCKLKSNCRRREWYHVSCLQIKTSDLPEIWYCCEACELGAEDDDLVLNYSKGLIWEGLNLLARRDAVRYGDGPDIISHWRIDMVQFWNLNHYKYFTTGCQMLTNIAGFLPERLQKDIVWNRLANVKGKKGGNIGLDLLNEFLNNDFKEMLKNTKGQYTDLQVERVSRLSGAFGSQLDSLLTESGLAVLDTAKYHERPKWIHDDVVRFVSEYKDDGLLEYCPPRAHKAFPNFINDCQIKSPVKMGQRISDITAAMDFWRDIRDA